MKKTRSFFYELSARTALLSGSRRKFMNLGYVGEKKILVNPEDRSEKHHIALYLKLLEQVPVISSSSSILEIGCGRGGGCYVFQKYFGAQKITGVDQSTGNLRIARKNVPGPVYLNANAHDFRLPDTYDLVVNLESSHNYPSRKVFFQNVHSSLKPSGYFALGDLIRKEVLEEMEKDLVEAGFKLLHKENINAEVINSIDRNSRAQYPFVTRFPFLFPAKLHAFLATIHSSTFKRLKEKEVFYNLYVLQKI